MQLTAVLTLLAAAYQTGRSEDEACPLRCIRSFAVATPDGVEWIKGTPAGSVAEVMQVITGTSPSSPTQEVTINGERVLVPRKVKKKIVRLLEAHPELSPLILKILNTTSATPYGPSEAKTAPPSDNYHEEPMSPTNYQRPESIPVNSPDSEQTRTWSPEVQSPRPNDIGTFFPEYEQSRKPHRNKKKGPEMPTRSNDIGTLISEHEQTRKPHLNKKKGPEMPTRSNDIETLISENEHTRRPHHDKKGSENFQPDSNLDFNSPFPDLSQPSSPEYLDVPTTESNGGLVPAYSSPDEDTSSSEGAVKIKEFSNSNFTDSSPEEDQPWSSDNRFLPQQPTGESHVLEIPGLVNALPRDQGIPEDVQAYLDFLQKNPSFFVPIYEMLVSKGVKFPDLRKPMNHIAYKGIRFNLRRKVTATYTVKINDRSFTLPKDARNLAKFVSQNPENLPAVVIAIRQLGGTMTTDSTGKLKGFELFGKPTKFTTPLTPRISASGRPFTLPEDIRLLVAALKNNPEKFHNILPLLEVYGVRPEKSPSGEIKWITIKGKRFPVQSVRPVPVTLGDRVYNIPADLEEIFRQPRSQLVGELLRALQKSKVPVVVDRDTGNVVGIEKDGVRIPFPIAIQLVLKMGRRKFVIPRDLPSVVTHLERRGLPSDALNALFDFGVLPVRNADNAVTAIEFNGQRYPVKPQPDVSIKVAGNKLSLPRDNEKLVKLVSEGKIPIGDFLRVVQKAGYRLLPGPDGVLRSALKGFEVIALPKKTSLILNINNISYSIPDDLPQVVKLLRTVNDRSAVKKILDSLESLGVDVRRRPDKTTLRFNSKNYAFSSKPRPTNVGTTNVAPNGGTSPNTVVDFNGRSFRLPKDAEDLVKTVRGHSPAAITMLVKTLRANGFQVNLTPSGKDIASIVKQGKNIWVSGKTGTNVPAVKNARLGPTGRDGDQGRKLQVTIRGKNFTMPDDLPRLHEAFPNFQYGELVRALNKAGAKVEADHGKFYGMRVNGGSVVNFPTVFTIGVEADGKKFGLPDELPQLAKTLSSCKWPWKAVRDKLADVGVELKYGSQGAPSAIVFQGQQFKLHGTPTA